MIYIRRLVYGEHIQKKFAPHINGLNELAANQFNGKCVLNICKGEEDEERERVLKLFAQLSNLKGNGFSSITSKRLRERRLELNF
jgi:hypothetical protein